nr:LPD7 domain-containing protein [Klebsiella pneumoniae]
MAADAEKPELAEQWRHRASEPQRIEGASGEPPTPRDIRAYQPEIVGQQVHYSRKEEAGAAGCVFRGQGKKHRYSRLAQPGQHACRLAAIGAEVGQLHRNGNDEYKAMCAKLAAEHGFKITNPELQERISRSGSGYSRRGRRR